MKVICVKPIDKPSPSAMNKPRPKVGDIDVVTDEVYIFGSTFFELERFGNDSLFASECFATLDSNLDENFLTTEYFDEKYCIPVTELL